MIFAEAWYNSNVLWTVMPTGIVIILVQIGKMMSDSRKYKKEVESDKHKQSALDRIALSNEEGVKAQLGVKEALKITDIKTEFRHLELLSALGKDIQDRYSVARNNLLKSERETSTNQPT
jgi:hypothetical protein